jgi:hypothetical protein
MDNVVIGIRNENSDTIFDSEAFNTIIGSIAISAAVSAVAEYFDVKPEDIDSLLK